MQIILVKNSDQGAIKAKDFLHDNIDNKTVLFLSGGLTPKSLYTLLAKEKFLRPGAVGMVDERYGKSFHENSNEMMIKESGLLHYLELQNIPFHPIIQPFITREAAAELYDSKVRNLLFQFSKSVVILGIGADGHTSSILPNRSDFINPMFEKSQKSKYISDFDDKKVHGQRIGMTFTGLSAMDFLIVLVFGKNKKQALKKMLQPGPIEDIPSRLFMEQELSKKTIIITDQKV